MYTAELKRKRREPLAVYTQHRLPSWGFLVVCTCTLGIALGSANNAACMQQMHRTLCRAVPETQYDLGKWHATRRRR